MCLYKANGQRKKLSEQPLLNHMERSLAVAIEELQDRIKVLEERQTSRIDLNEELNKQ